MKKRDIQMSLLTTKINIIVWDYAIPNQINHGLMNNYLLRITVKQIAYRYNQR